MSHDLTRKLLDGIGVMLCERKLMMEESTIVDATIIEAPPSTKNSPSCPTWPRRQTALNQKCDEYIDRTENAGANHANSVLLINRVRTVLENFSED